MGCSEYLLARSIYAGSAIELAAAGRFCSAKVSGILLIKSTSLELWADPQAGKFELLCTQPLRNKVLDLRIWKDRGSSGEAAQTRDLAILQGFDGTVTFLRFCSKLQRLQLVWTGAAAWQADKSEECYEPLLAVDLSGQAWATTTPTGILVHSCTSEGALESGSAASWSCTRPGGDGSSCRGIQGMCFLPNAQAETGSSVLAVLLADEDACNLQLLRCLPHTCKDLSQAVHVDFLHSHPSSGAICMEPIPGHTADDSEITSWAWQSPPSSFEHAFSSLSTADPPCGAAQSSLASLAICTAAGLLWRITFPPEEAESTQWALAVQVDSPRMTAPTKPFILPSEPPVTHCLGLPNGHLLLINNTADACTVALPPNPHPSPGSIRVPTQLEAAQPNALPCSAPMSDIAIADLQGLGQDQVYAACGRGRQGTLQVIHSAGVLEELHTSSPPCEGIYRMWPAVMRGLPSGRDGGAPHTLIILSFVNGTRVMAAAGGALADVTEEVGVEGAAQTLAAGAVGPHHLLQVLADRVLLCRLLECLAGKPPRSFKVRRRRESSSSGDSTVGSAEDHSRAFVDSPGVSSHSYPEDESMQAVGLENVWRPPSGTNIGAAAVCDDVAVVSCAPSRMLIALQAQAEGETEPPSPGKRKRSPGGTFLMETAQVAMETEVSCMAVTPSGGAHRAGWLCLIGTYQPAVQLWQLTAAGFLLLGSVDVGDTSPRLSPSLPDPLGGEEGSQPSHHVPESVQLLPQAQDEGVQVLCGLRSSLLLHLHFSLRSPGAEPPSPMHEHDSAPMADDSPHMTTTSPPIATNASPHVISRQRFGTSMPLGLVPLPPGLGFQTLALADRPELLRVDPGAGCVQNTPLAATQIAHAAPWLTSSAEPGLPTRCLILCASVDGMLRLLELTPSPQGLQKSFPLQATPRKLAVCRDPVCVALLCNTVEPEAPPSNPIAPHEASDPMGDDDSEDELLGRRQQGDDPPEAPRVWDVHDPFVRLRPRAHSDADSRDGATNNLRTPNICQDDVRCVDPLTGTEMAGWQLQPGERASCIAAQTRHPPEGDDEDASSEADYLEAREAYDKENRERQDALEEQLALAVHLASEFARPAENQASEFARNARPVRHSEAPSAPVDEHDTNIQDPEGEQATIAEKLASEFSRTAPSQGHEPPSAADELHTDIREAPPQHAEHEHAPPGSYLAVGTCVGSQEDDDAMEEERPLGRWGGRLLLFTLTHPTRQGPQGAGQQAGDSSQQLSQQAGDSAEVLSQMRDSGDEAGPACAPVELRYACELEYASGVHALCWLSHDTLIVSAGMRIIAYRIAPPLGLPQQLGMHMLNYTSTQRVVTSLQLGASTKTIAAGDNLEGIWVYSFSEREGFKVLYADCEASCAIDGLPLEHDGAVQGAIAVDDAGRLSLSKARHRRPERSLTRRSGLELGAPGTRLLTGSLAFKALDTLTRAPSADGASQAWVAATSAGSLHAVRSIDGHTWHLLQSVQKAMASHPGFDSSLHSLLDHAGGWQQNAVDGDILLQLLSLPASLQHEIICKSCLHQPQAAPYDGTQTDLYLRHVIEIVQKVLNELL